jgi:benzodiazapine receptor
MHGFEQHKFHAHDETADRFQPRPDSRALDAWRGPRLGDADVHGHADAHAYVTSEAAMLEAKAESPAGSTRVAAAAIAVGLSACAALTGAAAPPDRWYRTLRKPAFQPPDAVFAPVWTVLYATIAASGFRVLRAPRSPRRSRALRAWGTQLALNAAWSPLFFRAHRPRAALLDLGLLVAATGHYITQARRVDRTAAALMLPYLGWSLFALALNASIVHRNPSRVG